MNMSGVDLIHNYLIEEAKLTDIEGIKQLLIQLVPELKTEYGLMLIDLSDSIKSQHNKWFVIKDAGVILGCCQLIIYSNLVRSPLRKAIIDSVIIDEKYQNRGFGKLLIHQVVQYAKECNVGKVQLISTYKRKIAHEFYECQGFKNVGYGFVKDL